jgi:hypothetical protein
MSTHFENTSLKHFKISETHAHEKKQLVNEIVSLKKYKDSSERESSRREVHVKQVETEANKGLDALREAEERTAMLRTQVEFGLN